MGGGFHPASRRPKARTYAAPYRYDENGDLELTPADYNAPPQSAKVLTDRHKLFVEHYLTHWSPEAAAVAIGYAPSIALEQGTHLLRRAHIRSEIRRRMQEKVMSADEVLARLSKQARGSIADFITITPEGPVFDFEKAERAGQLDLIKDLKTKTKVLSITTLPGRDGEKAGEPGSMESAVVGIEIDFKLYDAQAALKLIGQTYDLFGNTNQQNNGSITLRIEYGNTDPNNAADLLPGEERGAPGNIHGRKMIPVHGFNPLDAEDSDGEGDDDMGTGVSNGALPLDPRIEYDQDNNIIDTDDYEVEDGV